MGTVQPIFGRLRQLHPKGRSRGPKNSPFQKLPLKPLLLIASYLSLESVACLSLSCHYLYACLRAVYLESLNKSEYLVMNRLLNLLERDLQFHIVCPHCNKLHLMHFDTSNLLIHRQRSTTNKPWLECWVADSVDDVFRGIHIAFSSTIFRLAMKAHRQGYNTTEFLRQLSYTTQTEPNWGFVKHHKADARIKYGSLLVRQLTVYMVPSWRQTRLPCSGDVYICHHIKMKSMRDLQRHGICIPQADEIKLYENRQGILYCDRCYTEFRVDFKSYGEAGNAMFITKWMGIGEGRDLIDLKWKSRRGGSDRVSWRKIDYQRGSISAAFEETAKFKLDSLLTEQDKKDLLWKKSPMPWPKYLKGPPKEVTPYFMVRNGRFIRLAEKGADNL